MEQHKPMFCGSVVPPLSPKYPWCVAGEEDTQVHIFYNLHDPISHYHCKIPELLGKHVRGCFHGCWALLSSNQPHDVMWSLWNPFTSKVITLPPLNHNGDDIRYYCLSAPPDHPDSVLLLTRTKKPNFVYCRLGIDSSFANTCKRKDLRWTESTYAKQVRKITRCDGLVHCLTCCNDKIYAYIQACDSNHRNLLLVEVNIVVRHRKRKKIFNEVSITLLPILEHRCCPTRTTTPTIFRDPIDLILLKGSSTELFTIVIGLEDKRKTVVAVSVFKLDTNNITWVEMEDLKDTTLSVELATPSSPLFYSPAISSSEFGGYIHILADKGKIIYSYHVKDKTISLSSMPCLAGANHVSAWAMRLEADRVHVDRKQEKEGVRSVQGYHEVESHLLYFPFHGLKMKEFCVGVESLPNFGYKCRLESDNTDLKQDDAKDVDIILRSVKHDEDESHLLNLPPHVLEMVMEFSVGIEYLKFRSTCKCCHLAAPLIHWDNEKASNRLQKYSLLSPWLIVFDKHKGIITFTDPVFGDKYFIKTPQKLICDFQIMCSRYGWLLILKPDRSLVLFNPFTSDISELPELPHSHTFSFSAPPTSPDCMVVGTVIYVGYHIACIHFVGGEPSWRAILLDAKIFGEIFKSATFYNRDIYAVRADGGLDVLEEFGREKHSWVRNVAQAPISCGGASFSKSFQVKCEQHLIRVIVGGFGDSVEVFKLNDYTHEWVKINGLGKHMIFICDASSICVDAKTPQMENKIYFPMSPIVYYSLETCRFHTFDNTNIQDSFRDFFGTKHFLTPHGWIEPSWS